MNLGMTVMASCYYISSLGGLDLLILDFSIKKSFVFKTRLQISTAAAAAEVVALIWISIHKIFFTDTGFDNKTNVISCCVAKGFTDDVARVLNGEFDLKILVPLGTGL